MLADLKARWVTALRSGEYTQGHGVLRTKDDKYCCLGVLADLINPSGWQQVVAWTEPNGTPHHRWGWCDGVSDQKYESVLSFELESGGESQNFIYPQGVDLSHSDQSALWHMNDAYDGTDFSFADIANFVEENIPAE